MDKNIKERVCNELYHLGFYWLAEENPSASYSILSILKQTDLSESMKQNVQNLQNEWKKTFQTIDTKSFQEIPIKGETEDERLLCAASTILTNLFAMGAYEVAYGSLLKMGEDWKDLYYMVVALVSKLPNVKHISAWAMSFFMFGVEINNLQKECMKATIEQLLEAMFDSERPEERK